MGSIPAMDSPLLNRADQRTPQHAHHTQHHTQHPKRSRASQCTAHSPHIDCSARLTGVEKDGYIT